MSHVVSVQCQLRDPIAIAAACRRLGLAAPVEGKAQLFSGEERGLIVQLPGWIYPTVIDSSTGNSRFDNYEGRRGALRELERLRQMNAVEKAKLEANKRGHAVTESELKDGSIRLQIATV